MMMQVRTDRIGGWGRWVGGEVYPVVGRLVSANLGMKSAYSATSSRL
jgi:hypothetical protein